VVEVGCNFQVAPPVLPTAFYPVIRQRMGAGFSSHPTIINCSFDSNTAVYGGGIYNHTDPVTIVKNCTLYNNSTIQYGGGLYNSHSVIPPILTNCIFWGNTAPTGNQIYDNATSSLITYSDIQDGYIGTGNIDRDPLFVDPGNGDLHLIANFSPCIDAGSNTVVGEIPVDFEGDNRIIDGDTSPGSIVDMGVDETLFAVPMPPPGNCLDFDGGNDSVQVPDSASLQFGSGAFTIEAWVQNQNTTGSIWKRIVTKRAGTASWYSLCLSGYQLQLELAAGENFTAGPNIQGDSKWHHVAAVRSGSGNIFLYVDGTEYPVGASATNTDNSSDIEIGKLGTEDYGGEIYRGKIDEVRIWNVARSGSEMLANMNQSLIGNEAGLAAYYRFDHDQGTLLGDFTTNHNNGTLYNMDDSDWIESYAMVRPGTLAATNAGTSTFTANWTAPAIGGTPTKYYLDVATDSGFSSMVSGYDNLDVGDVTSYAVTGLSNETEYFYRVRAFRNATTGQSQSSDGVSATTSSEITVAIQVNLQGTNRPQSGWEIPINIGFYSTGKPDSWFLNPGSAMYYFSGTTTAISTDGGTRAYFQCPDPIAPGTYDITADSTTTLLNVKKGISIR